MIFAVRSGIGCMGILMAGLIGCSSGTGGSTTAAAPNSPYAGYTQSYSVPWVGSPNFANLTSTLTVQAEVNGGKTASYTVDTGSVGVVVPASEVPNIPANSPSGSLLYTSSGLQLNGVWATMPVSFPQAVNASGSNVAAISTVPVLAVTSSSCTGSGVNSGSCTGAIPHMLGVGFGRGTDVYSSPPYNAFLNLAEMTAGTMVRGYIIQRTGLVLGLTTANVGSSFVEQTLVSAGTPASGTHTDWTIPAGGFKVGSSAAVSGTALVDTGLLDMIVETSGEPSSGSVASATAMTITLGTQSYSFAVSDGGAQTPTSVNWATTSHGTFVNTGLHALGHFDLLFDANNGLFGLRPE